MAAWSFVALACAQGSNHRRDGAALNDAGIDAPQVPDVDGGPVGADGGPPPIERDAGSPGFDAWSPPDVDAGPTPVRRAYLDRCVDDGECASGRCVPDWGGTRFCTRTCTSDLECAHEHLCVEGICRHDDTGAPCSTGSPERCATGLCLGSAAGGQCTRYCTTAAECPAGYACTRAGGSTRPICVDIERPCSAADDCGTGLCVSMIGCTAECTSAADCPRRFDGLPPYRCAVAYGWPRPLCVPPDDVVGSDPIGASCRRDARGLWLCRSGACDESAPLGPMCTQACTAQGNCAPGLGCFPLADASGVTLSCQRAGSGDLGQPCRNGRECRSGLCDAGGFCTRLCQDGLCPSDMRCEPVAGAGVALCRRP
jgi:hypothetical protein